MKDKKQNTGGSKMKATTINELIEMDPKEFKTYRDKIVAEWENGKEDWRYGVWYFSTTAAGFNEEQTKIFYERILPMRETLREIENKEKQNRLLNTPPVQTVMCDCGHRVQKNLVMSASLGTSCSYCYDEMSS